MNPVAFILAILFIAFIYPIFKGMVEDCFHAAGRQSSGPIGATVDQAFNLFLGLLIAFVFLALCVALLYVGTQPTAFFR